MKVWHKRLSDLPHTQWEVIEKLEPYYICYGREGGPNVALPIQDYEPVSTDHWQDVTGECYLGGIWGREICHNILTDINYPINHRDYRLRKVQLWERHVDRQVQWIGREVFIVERKVSE